MGVGDNGHYVLEDKEPCLKCGSFNRRVEIQKFSNGTKHLRMMCSKCQAFVRYLSQGERFSDRLFSVVKDLAGCEGPVQLASLILRAQELVKEAESGKG